MLRYPLGSGTSQADQVLDLPKTTKAGISPSRLQEPVRTLRGVGARTERKLGRLGIQTVGDLLLYLPFRHESPSRLVPVASVSFGEECALKVRVQSFTVRETARRGVRALEALVADDTGSLVAIWYNQTYLEEVFKEKPELLIRGVLRRRRGMPMFLVRTHEVLSEDGKSRHVLGLIPVYPSTADVSVRLIRTLVHEAAREAAHLTDPLPAFLLAKRRYPGKKEAILACHFPTSLDEAKRARERLAFEELLLLQLAVLEQRRLKQSRRRARPLGASRGLARQFLASLPYTPTRAQLRAIAEIDRDLGRDVPMCRLLHGDVGSGKTMVATYCLLRAVEQGAQGALMAPTEVLAEQHFVRLTEQLCSLGVRVGLLKGGQSTNERKAVLTALSQGELDIVVGTHALIQEGVQFRDLRVVVVDEQHRFGVRQREAIVASEATSGFWPHTLHMSATPIPRTLSLTIYGDLDVSVLDEMPSGRIPVRTRLVFPTSEARMWEFVRRELRAGRQAYVVCPLIEESESLQAASACKTFEELSHGELDGFRLLLLHGQLPAAEKASVMASFAQGQADVLVSTSVIEVGVDVPNATCMVIMGARRFGLSQLHQLRGRVGRGAEQSYCFLLIEDDDDPALERLALFARTSNGFALAEADLLARGEGQLFGERQSGMGDLEVASLIRDRQLLEEARVEAVRLLARSGEPGWQTRLEQLLEAAKNRFGEKIAWMERV
ncbi:MAG: ATP-dependent DNA helicase RecG [Thermoleophilia bacterium]|nr:ATP-dependent DNA helicase RecG [Thermoleophilia bacterium]